MPEKTGGTSHVLSRPHLKLQFNPLRPSAHAKLQAADPKNLPRRGGINCSRIFNPTVE
jgi:hypothetical protein